MRRRGHTIIELSLVIVLLGVLMMTLLADGALMARQHAALAGHADDLRAAVRHVDLLAREVRCAAGLLPRSPDGAVRLGARALVTRTADGGALALSVEPTPDAARPHLLLRRYGPTGALVAREDLGLAGDLTLTYDAPRAAEVKAITIDLTLTPRGGRAAPPTLSTRALVRGDVGGAVEEGAR